MFNAFVEYVKAIKGDEEYEIEENRPLTRTLVVDMKHEKVKLVGV